MAGRPRKKSETSEKYEQRQLEVFRAAARTFNRLGFHIATLDDVATELGVTKPALYYYARSKDELLFACSQMALGALNAALDQSSAAELNGLERLASFFRLYAEIICEDFGRCLVLTEPRDLVPKSRKDNVAGRRSLNHSVREIIRAGIRDGSIQSVDARVLSMSLFDSINGLARWFDANGPTRLSAVIDQYLVIFVKGIAASPSSRPGRVVSLVPAKSRI
jgi:AcrR family transcriptional regulator